MRQTYSFHRLVEYADNSRDYQIETKLKEWNFGKNINNTTWDGIYHHIIKRKYDGKESEVIHHGRRKKPKTVRKETERYCNTSIPAQLVLRKLRLLLSLLGGRTDIEQ